MGLTGENSGFKLNKKTSKYKKGATTVALIGNPNVGKSTLFNALTGMNQHTGNWSGKTVEVAYGTCEYNNKKYNIVDLPGTYSLYASSKEEELARDYILKGEADAFVVVCDSTAPTRSLGLVLQVLELRKNIIVCFNLADEAKSKGIVLDTAGISRELSVPVISTSKKENGSHKKIIDGIEKIISEKESKIEPITYSKRISEELSPLSNLLSDNGIRVENSDFLSVMLLSSDSEKEMLEALVTDRGRAEKILSKVRDVRQQLFTKGITKQELSDIAVNVVTSRADELAGKYVKGNTERSFGKFDKLIMGKWTAYPIMLLLLFGILYLTVSFANYPSELLAHLFDYLGSKFVLFLEYIGTPVRLKSFLYDGIYIILTNVISVMLPPMAIFFPLFTLLEDIGVLPRIAYNLDSPFRCVGACGKQALTMCMGLGCNAAGITGCRIIESERERRIAQITNSCVPCNGKFPTIILIISTFCASGVFGGVMAAIGLVGVVVFGVLSTFVSTLLLSKFVYRGKPSFFVVELPPYRVPNIPRVLFRSFIDRTLSVLLRAICVALPMGALLWITVNIDISGSSILHYICSALEPIGRVMGMDGTILSAFILGLPANEIVLPIAVMGYTNAAVGEAMAMSDIGSVLISFGWSAKTAICTVLFSLLHWPCSTSLITLYKETRSAKAVILSVLLPTALGFLCCVLVNILFVLIL